LIMANGIIPSLRSQYGSAYLDSIQPSQSNKSFSGLENVSLPPGYYPFQAVGDAIAGAYPSGVNGGIGSNGVGQGVNNNLQSAGLGLLNYSQNPIMPGALAAGLLGGIITDQQLQAMSDAQAAAGQETTPGMQTVSDAYGNVISVSNPNSIEAANVAMFGPEASGMQATGTGIGGASDANVSGANSEASHVADGNSAAPSSKIICTAMNHAYGFGSFRNAIWIAYADKHLTKAHEAGYHALFLPLVDFGFKRGNGKLNMAVRKVLEWGTRHRSTDLRAEMRGTKRDTTGRIIRFIFEPLCFAVGKLKGY
jgi:hypothetical protein